MHNLLLGACAFTPTTGSRKLLIKLFVHVMTITIHFSGTATDQVERKKN
jgi:hypothetical protein